MRQVYSAAFLIDQSPEYLLALLLSITEFWLEYLFLGQWKLHLCASFGGALLITSATIMWLGQGLRSLGMATAGFAFTHQIQQNQRTGHTLVIHGIYSIFRHPGYTGWFYASIATQVLLCNPICFVLYSYAAWSFFARRIPHEEFLLYRMFGQPYLEFRARTFVFIPLIPSPMDVLVNQNKKTY
jgi:protein-S-isoprenylcysteine O-methyltransferase